MSMQYAAWRFASATVPALPAALDNAIAIAVGGAAYGVAPRARAAVRANLAVMRPELPEDERERLVRRAFVHQAWNYTQMLRIPRLTRRQLLARVDISGWEHVESALARGSGLILASAHFGPIAVVGPAAAARGPRFHVLAEATEPRLFELINQRLRGSTGARFVPADAVMQIYRTLKGNGAVGVLADRAITGVGLRVPLFGRPALLPVGHVLLAMRTGAPLVPGFAAPGGRPFRGEALPPLDIEPGKGEGLARENLLRWAAVLERQIARAPEEWHVFERVWER